MEGGWEAAQRKQREGPRRKQRGSEPQIVLLLRLLVQLLPTRFAVPCLLLSFFLSNEVLNHVSSQNCATSTELPDKEQFCLFLLLDVVGIAEPPSC